MVQDGLEQSFADLSFEFSTTLDQDNPLASRYLRVFPEANVFGWTKSSPGEKSGSERSLLYHMAHMARISQGRPAFNPLTGNSVPEVEALLLEHVHHFLLAQDLQGSAYDIRDFRESLLLSIARHQLADTPFYLAIVRTPGVQNATFYTMAWSFLKESPDGAALIIEEIIRLPATDSGVLRGAALWVMTHGAGEDPGLLAAILSHPAADEATLDTVASVLARYDLPRSEIMVRGVVAHPRTGGMALRQVSLAIRKQDLEIERKLLEEILSHPSVDKWGVQNVAQTVARSKDLGSPDFLFKIVNHDQVDAGALSSVAFALGNDHLEQEPELLSTIASHPKADERTLRYVDRARARKDSPVQDKKVF